MDPTSPTYEGRGIGHYDCTERQKGGDTQKEKKRGRRGDKKSVAKGTAKEVKRLSMIEREQYYYSFTG